MDSEPGLPIAVPPGAPQRIRLNDSRLWVTAIITVLLLGVFFVRLDYGNLRAELRDANYAWVAAAIAANFISQGFRAIRHHYLLLPTRKIAVTVLLGAIVIGSAINNVLPLRGGSVARVQLLAKRYDVSRPTLAATLTAEMVLDTLVISIFLVVGISVLHLGPFLGWLATVILVVSLLALTGVWFLSRAARKGMAAVEDWLSFLSETTRRAIAGGILSFEQGWQAFWRAHHAIPLLIASAGVWLSESVAFWFFGLAVGLDLSFLSYVTLVAAADIATSLTFTPAGLGAFEVSVSELLRQLGASSAVAGAYVVLSHAVLTVSMMAVAPLAFVLLRVRLADLLYLRRESPSTTASPAQT
ncbi:MAG TPA: lysylphosphatidylglycerol synthase transmembrane domain-containing protein [Dehalococcoidia bacterium]|nr:lysylphosphatidylglycerol synthase transmembrane domain-containing protein [Dehalococcoidia bacterium]